MTDPTSLPRLRTVTTDTEDVGGLSPPGVADSVELVIDFIGATKLVPPDKLARAVGRARQTGSLPRALVEEGIASSEGVARRHAAQFRLPLVDFVSTPVDDSA